MLERTQSKAEESSIFRSLTTSFYVMIIIIM